MRLNTKLISNIYKKGLVCNEKIIVQAYAEFEKKLNKYSSFKINDRAKIEDLVQETFMKTWMYMDRGGKIKSMKSFLFNIINNLIIDEYRKKKSLSLDAMIIEGFDPISSDNKENSADVFDGENLLLMIKKIPEHYQQALHMRYIRDLSLKEMSIITGQSNNTLSSQICRGLKKLRPLFNLS